MVLRIGLAALVVTAGITVGATVDHHAKNAAANRADVSAWYCRHGKPARCRATKPATIERRWELREKLYEGGFAAGVAILLGALIVGVLRPPHRR